MILTPMAWARLKYIVADRNSQHLCLYFRHFKKDVWDKIADQYDVYVLEELLLKLNATPYRAWLIRFVLKTDGERVTPERFWEVVNEFGYIRDRYGRTVE